MYEGVRSPLIYTPRTIGEFATVIRRHPQAILWAGGTYLMSQPDYYPGEAKDGIIDLSHMEELKRITRNDRYVEIGAMVTARQLLSTGRLLLPPILQQTLQSLGTQVVRRQITIGGALCISDTRLVQRRSVEADHQRRALHREGGYQLHRGWLENHRQRTDRPVGAHRQDAAADQAGMRPHQGEAVRITPADLRERPLTPPGRGQHHPLHLQHLGGGCPGAGD